ncbi:MAG: hypothetical protein HYV27_17580 [Candidatus Hydrogenedentes bacterium]|nr:hypothetical protein [Candidatus Hydrogenedentota bacterium]
MSCRPSCFVIFALGALGLICSNVQGQVVFSSIEDFSGSNVSTSVGLQSCSENSPDIALGASSASGTSTCTSGSGEFVTAATSTFSGLFTGDALDVDSASLSAQLEAVADANPPGNIGSKSSTANSFIKMNFNTLSPVRYRVTLSASVDSAGFSQFVADKASVTLAHAGFAVFETLSVEQNSGTDTQTVVREGILPVGAFFLSASATGSADSIAADAATASATLEVTFEPILSGGCCIDNACTEFTREECAAESGVYAGDNEACVDCEAEVESCDLAWAASAPGNFAGAGNWSPEVAPEACANLTLDQDGAYAITLGSGATANSLAALGGEPSLVGGALSLGGQGVPEALRVDNDARLSLGSGTLSANGAVIGTVPVSGEGALPSFFRIEPGATLDLAGGLDLGREANSFGELSLGGGAEGATLTVAGGANVGVFGRGHLLGLGSLDMTILDGMTLGVFTGSDALVELTGGTEGIGLVFMTVGEALTIGDGGTGVLALSTPALLETDSIALGASAGGNGTLTTSGANCGVNASTAIDVGVTGKGEIIILEASAVRAPLATLGKGTDSQGEVTIEGQDSRLAISGELTVGGLGGASLSANSGGIIEAGTLTAGNGAGVTGSLNLNGLEAEVSLLVTNDATLGAFGGGNLAGAGSTRIAIGGSLTLGAFADATAIMFVTAGEGEDSLKLNKLTVADTLRIGAAGDGSASFTGSSIVEAGTLSLGTDAGSEGAYTVSGALNFTKVFGQLTIAGGGNGEVTARDFASIQAGACVLGGAPGGLGVMRLNSGATLHVAAVPASAPDTDETKGTIAVGFLEVGEQSNGLIELFDTGTRLTCENAVLGGETLAAGGTLSVDTGATLAVSGSLAMGTNAGPALMRVASGGTVDIALFLLVGPKGLLASGLNAQIGCSTLNVEGRLRTVENLTIERPADAGKSGEAAEAAPSKGTPGPVVIDGNLEMGADGVLEVSVTNGTALRVTGTATLAGNLEVFLEPGMPLAENQQFDLIDFAGGVTGDFASVTFLNAPEGFEGDTILDAGVLRLDVIDGGTASGEGEGEGEGEPAGCNAAKVIIQQSFQKIMGDLLLMALALGGMLALSSVRNRP